NKASHTFATQPRPIGQPFARQCPEHQAAWAKLKAPDGKPFVVGCTYLPYDTSRYTVSAPSFLGGADWPPSAYSPQTGFMYICSKDAPFYLKSVPAEDQVLQPRGNFGQLEGGPIKTFDASATFQGRIVAMNMRTNRIAWQHK